MIEGSIEDRSTGPSLLTRRGTRMVRPAPPDGISPVYDDDGSMSGFSTIARNDSARKGAERALQQQADLLASRVAKEAEASKRLRELDRIKDDLIATVSHELRTPLTSILGYLQLLRDVITSARRAL